MAIFFFWPVHQYFYVDCYVNKFKSDHNMHVKLIKFNKVPKSQCFLNYDNKKQK